MPRTNTDNLGPSRRGCTKCGRVGHYERACRYPEKVHLRIGVEIEGFWQDLQAAKRRANASGCRAGNRDGSLTSEPNCSPWEFPTKPGSLSDVMSALRKMYPDATNESCGMHIHISFAAKHMVSSLATPEFWAFFKAQWSAWGTMNRINPESQFWVRLNGENGRYCALNTEEHFTGDSVTGTRTRYLQINFQPWSSIRTVEFRHLPMFRDARLALSALEHMVDIVEVWLNAPERMLAEQVTYTGLDVPGWGLSDISTELLTSLPSDEETRVEMAVVRPAPCPDGFRRVCGLSGLANFMSARPDLS